MITRIFHPMGQGAFYSERHKNFNIVYDCGTHYHNRGKEVFNKVVKHSFKDSDEIDILFISHFDYDHVSKIGELKDSVKRIKKVVLPLLHENEKNLLINFHLTLGLTEIVPLINSPEDFFGDETQIIKVRSMDMDSETRSSDADKNIDEFEDIDTMNVDNKIEIESGKGLKKLFDDYLWVYIPYNYKYKDRSSELKKLLDAEGIDVNKLITGNALTEVISERSKIKKVYNKLKGDINQNSMIVYSGIISEKSRLSYDYFNTNTNQDRLRHTANRIGLLDNRVSCIYTGDADLNKVDIKFIFSQYFKYVSTIQIPHHGDIKSFRQDILDDKFYICPISHGEHNPYAHPSSDVVNDILTHLSYPISVTENLSSLFIEVIRTRK